MAADRTITLGGEDGVVQRFLVVSETGRKGRPADRKGYSSGYVTVFQDALAQIAADRGLTRTDFRVWAAALSRATLESPIWDADPRAMGQLLHMDAREVSRAVTRLVDRGLLLRPERGKLALPPETAWRGRVESRELALKTRKEAS